MRFTSQMAFGVHIGDIRKGKGSRCIQLSRETKRVPTLPTLFTQLTLRRNPIELHRITISRTISGRTICQSEWLVTSTMPSTLSERDIFQSKWPVQINWLALPYPQPFGDKIHRFMSMKHMRYLRFTGFTRSKSCANALFLLSSTHSIEQFMLYNSINGTTFSFF